jgi:mersacidin/lichenicidin family type 2 lantibiotic
MSANTIARAWKDEEFRASLAESERAALPENPAGNIELPDSALRQVNGGCCSFTRTSCGVYCAITREFHCTPPITTR